eukprot:CAMPEP_0113485660 /NCGR_PEP_ID=MMETSP0014_2-20120614/24597_1 /TAXON_ID=2857 /ORGANISM="Nitzschia sp." /LENGTH=204 /DNA_ID=CAMNT_0000379311 /DNA_START=138 /DNA_END=752 /DNA_ORIENTATION=- /assembly_acc=CAM_ASM_000159
MPKNEYSYGSVEDGGSSSKKRTEGVDAEKAAGDDGDDFKETDLLYVTSQSRPLTPEEKRMKIIKIAVPIVVAMILIGGFALFLLRGFTDLYPGPSGSSSSDNGGRSPPYYEPLHETSPTAAAAAAAAADDYDNSMPVPAPMTPPKSTSKSSSSSVSSTSSSSSSSSSSTSSSSSSCGDNSKCSAAGLTGQCCPTAAGDMLDCCS